MDVTEPSKSRATAAGWIAAWARFLAEDSVPGELFSDKFSAQGEKYRELDSSASTLGGYVPVELSLGRFEYKARGDWEGWIRE